MQLPLDLALTQICLTTDVVTYYTFGMRTTTTSKSSVEPLSTQECGSYIPALEINLEAIAQEERGGKKEVEKGYEENIASLQERLLLGATKKGRIGFSTWGGEGGEVTASFIGTL